MDYSENQEDFNYINFNNNESSEIFNQKKEFEELVVYFYFIFN